MTTLVLAEDHTIVRKALRSMLEGENDLHIQGEAKDGIETVELVERERPDVLVVDIAMEGVNGLDVIRQLKDRAPETRFVVLSMHNNEAYMAEAFRLGASAYILKGADTGELVAAIRAAAQGERYFSGSFTEAALNLYLQKSQGGMRRQAELLTPREQQVLALTTEGLSSIEIGRRLSIKQRTIETHQANIMRKLGVHSKTDLIRFALQNEIVPLDDWISKGYRR